MGIFSDNVRKYADCGISLMPVGEGKKPDLGNGWQKYCDEMPDENTIGKWEDEYKKCDMMGIALGKASNLVAFDFDYEYDQQKVKITREEFEKDKAFCEQIIRSLLPPSPCEKVGKKGWTAFYRPDFDCEQGTNDGMNRNSVRLFDFLSWHKHTVIPESVYNADTNYKWTKMPILSCLDDLPSISLTVVADIKMALLDEFDFSKPQGFSGRHGKVALYALGIYQVEKDINKIIKASVEYDVKVNSPAYLSDPKYFKYSSDPYKNAEPWLKRLISWNNKKNETLSLEKKQKPITSTYAWDYFFQNSFKEVIKDVFSNETFFKNDKDVDWMPIKSMEKTLQSYSRRSKLPKTHVSEELSRWCYENENTEFLCKLPVWDGKDRLKTFANCIRSDKLSCDQIEEILKNWGVTVFRRLYDPEIQNRCVILKGGQGLGKDTLIRAMFGGFKPYYQQTTLTGTPKDALEIASRLLILHLEEFTQTKSMDIGFLKSLITQPSSFFRESYGYSPNAKPMRVSFFSSENLDDIFRDTTGNRRFIVIPVDEIKWDYPKNESPQVMAQLKSMYEKKLSFQVSKETEKAIKEIVDSLTPDPLENDIVALYLEKFKSLTSSSSGATYAPYPGKEFLSSTEIISAISDISKKCNCSIRRVQSAIKQAGLTHRSRVRILYFGSPEKTKSHKQKVGSEIYDH